jgi:membrane-bound lytic murein transglycosylase MltF
MTISLFGTILFSPKSSLDCPIPKRDGSFMNIAPTAALLMYSLLVLSVLPADFIGAETPTAPVIHQTQPMHGDLAEMKKRKFVRVLVSSSQTNFFLDNGRPYGFEYELAKKYERFLNTGVPKNEFQTHLLFIPVPFNQLIPELVAGKGDIAAGGLTITPERQRKVRFSDPYFSHMDEVVVSHKGMQRIPHLDGLSGQVVFLVKGSSYVHHVQAVSDELKRAGKAPIIVKEADEDLEAEDILQMVNAGIFKVTVVDAHIAHLWASVLPKIVVHDDLKVSSGGMIAWAVRKDNPALRKSLNAFMVQHKKGTLLGNIFFKRYYHNTKWITNPLQKNDQQKLNALIPLFKKYGGLYGFDWRAIAAQAYQESRLNNRRRSPRGAIGIMQVLPQTAKGREVNIPDIENLENNIHAGVKYLAHLRDHHFKDPQLGAAAQVNFVLASYNAGPTRIQRLRTQAKKRGLNPNIWFDNVEDMALEYIGQETVQYVSKIHKYYIAYQLLEESPEKKKTQRIKK